MQPVLAVPGKNSRNAAANQTDLLWIMSKEKGFGGYTLQPFFVEQGKNSFRIAKEGNER